MTSWRSDIARVLGIFLGHPDQRWFAYDLAKAAGVRAGRTYRIIHRLTAMGYLTTAWEERADGGPNRLGYWAVGEKIQTLVLLYNRWIGLVHVELDR